MPNSSPDGLSISPFAADGVGRSWGKLTPMPNTNQNKIEAALATLNHAGERAVRKALIDRTMAGTTTPTDDQIWAAIVSKAGMGSSYNEDLSVEARRPRSAKRLVGAGTAAPKAFLPAAGPELMAGTRTRR